MHWQQPQWQPCWHGYGLSWAPYCEIAATQSKWRHFNVSTHTLGKRADERDTENILVCIRSISYNNDDNKWPNTTFSVYLMHAFADFSKQNQTIAIRKIFMGFCKYLSLVAMRIQLQQPRVSKRKREGERERGSEYMCVCSCFEWEIIIINVSKMTVT